MTNHPYLWEGCHGEEEKERNIRARSLASPRWGGARRRAWAHDMCVNGPLKFVPKPHSSAASFCHLFLLRVRV
jgi:hypothetical protein